MSAGDDTGTFVFRHHPLLGTVVEVVVTARSERRARGVSSSVAVEIDRLDSVFSAYRSDSELNRWKRGDVPEPSDELCTVLSAALDWHQRSGGSFNPMSGLLTSLWARAEQTASPPTTAELMEAASSIADPRFELRNGFPLPIADCTDLNLNAIAKGYIVDRAVAVAAKHHQPGGLLVSAGGDLAHRGQRGLPVGVENPLRPYDNEPPLIRLQLMNTGLATSGAGRRGFRVGAMRHSHVIDPRTGEPATQQASISVVAPDAMTADVLATIAGLMSPPDAVDYIEDIAEVGCFVVDPSGRQWSDSTWTTTLMRADNVS